MKQVEGAYSLVVLTEEGLIACRDPLGIRPLVMGKLGEATIFASETVALDVIGARFIRDVEPGELVLVNDSGIRSFRPFQKGRAAAVHFRACLFLAPGLHCRGQSVYEVRKDIGAELSREAPVEADYVVPVPDSGVPAAIGFSQASRHSVRARDHPLALCRPHLHPAEPGSPPPRRQAEAQRQSALVAARASS